MASKDQSQEVEQEKAFIDKTHSEALALAERARSFISGRLESRDNEPSEAARAVYAVESMRMSTRIMQVIAWTMTQKAALEGEIDAKEALAPQNRLGAAKVCRHTTAKAQLELLPEPVRDMIHVSERLYERVRRIERLKMDSAQGSDGNPVRHLWERLDHSDLD